VKLKSFICINETLDDVINKDRQLGPFKLYAISTPLYLLCRDLAHQEERSQPHHSLQSITYELWPHSDHDSTTCGIAFEILLYKFQNFQLPVDLLLDLLLTSF